MGPNRDEGIMTTTELDVDHPALVSGAAPHAHSGVRRSPSGLRLLVALPALNEVATIAEVIRAIPRDIPGVGRVDVVVINDGSTDQTMERAMAAGAAVINHPVSRGVGAAFQTALTYGIDHGADLIVSIDSDGQFDPADIPKLVEPVLAGDADFATASRFKDPALMPQMPWIKRWGNGAMSKLISRLTGHTWHDVSCGFRCYNRRAALNLHLLGRFTYTQEVFMNLAFKDLTIVEVPIRVRGVREHGKSRVANNVLTYALKTSRIIFRCYRDYHPLRLFGAASAVLLLLSGAAGTFLMWHYVTTGGFSPHKWAGFAAAALLAVGLMTAHMGMVGDMLNRHRVYLEELLFYRRLDGNGTGRIVSQQSQPVAGDFKD